MIAVIGSFSNLVSHSFICRSECLTCLVIHRALRRVTVSPSHSITKIVKLVHPRSQSPCPRAHNKSFNLSIVAWCGNRIEFTCRCKTTTIENTIPKDQLLRLNIILSCCCWSTHLKNSFRSISCSLVRYFICTHSAQQVCTWSLGLGLCLPACLLSSFHPFRRSPEKLNLHWKDIVYFLRLLWLWLVNVFSDLISNHILPHCKRWSRSIKRINYISQSHYSVRTEQSITEVTETWGLGGVEENRTHH